MSTHHLLISAYKEGFKRYLCSHVVMKGSVTKTLVMLTAIEVRLKTTGKVYMG